jgi:hypothetical protein
MKNRAPEPRGDLFKSPQLNKKLELSSLCREESMSQTRAFHRPSYSLRHGSPDKVPAKSFAEIGDYFELECPECQAALCIDGALLAVSAEFDCAGCGRTLVAEPDDSDASDLEAVASGYSPR